MTLRILFFAVARERIRLDSSTLEAPEGLAVAQLQQLLNERFPPLSSITAKIAVNQEFVGDDYVLHDGDEVALIPPVSGGS